MLDVMRKHAQSWVIKGLFVIIIIVFILLYTAPGEKGTGLQVVANVEGSDITLSEYQRSYENLMNVYRNIFKEGLSEDMLKMLKLKEKALDNIIESRLILKEAERLALKVSDAELVESVSKYPAFQKDNLFDRAQYMALLKANRLTPAEFEEGQRKSLLVGKVEGLIKEGVKVSDEEVLEAYARQKEKVNLEVVKIEPRDFLKDVKVSEDEAREYFSKNKDSMKLPARVKVEFLTLNSQDVEKGINITEDDLRKYYEKNSDRFKKPEGGERPFAEVMGQVAAMFRGEKGEEVMRERIYKVKEETAKVKGLEEAAAKENLRVTKTGFISAGDMVEGIGQNPDFYREAFTLNVNEISQPVRTSAGYVLLRIVERQESRTPQYEDVKDKAFAAIGQKKAEEMAFKKGETLLAGLLEGRLNMSKLPYKTQETGLFARGGGVPNMAGASEDMNKAAFSLTKEKPYPAKPFSTSGITYIFKLKERLEADLEGLKTEEASIRERVAQQKGEEILKSWLKMARTKAKIKTYDEFLQ